MSVYMPPLTGSFSPDEHGPSVIAAFRIPDRPGLTDRHVLLVQHRPPDGIFRVVCVRPDPVLTWREFWTSPPEEGITEAWQRFNSRVFALVTAAAPDLHFSC